jgi:hypothetical protein
MAIYLVCFVFVFVPRVRVFKGYIDNGFTCSIAL